MAAYIVATVKIHDAERYQLYAQSIAGLSERFGGEAVVKGPVTEYLEGEDAGERIVVSRFPDMESARSYIASAEYQVARVARDGAVDVVMRLVEG